MRKNVKISLLILFLLVPSLKARAISWTLDGKVWSSPYQDERVYLSQLAITLKPHDHWQTTLSLPIQYTHSPRTQDLECLYPRVGIAWSVPLSDTVTSRVRLNYQFNPRKLAVQGGLETLHDPIALGVTLSYQTRTLALAGSVVFAANERWALGAHLHYSNNSLLTYKINHTSKRGKQRQFSYCHSLDGSLQSLGLKITF